MTKPLVTPEWLLTKMIPIVILRKILLFFAPIVIFYILRKIGKDKPKRKSQPLNIDKSSIVEGEIVKD